MDRLSETNASTTPQGASNPRRLRLYALLIVLATGAAYANSFPPIFTGLDARESIRDNRYIRDLWPPSHAMSLPLLEDTLAIDPGSKGGTMVRRPMLSVSFALNQAVFGNEPEGYHAVNLVIHVFAALALFGLVRRTLRAMGHRRSAEIGFAVALLWALHPLQTESVTNLVQRAESQMGLLYLLTLYCACRVFTSRDHATRWTIAATVACALGMGTKETMVTAPVVVLLYDWVFFARSRRGLARHWPLHASLFATWIVLVVLIVMTAEDAARDFNEGRTLPYILAQPGVILYYLRLAFWPDPLHVFVNTNLFEFKLKFTPLWKFFVPATVLAAAFIAAAIATLRRKPIGFLGVAFFVVLAPTSSIVATSDLIQEHRVYLSLACLIVLVVVAAERLLAHRPRIAFGLLAIVAIALAVRTHVRNWDYHSEFAVFHPGDLREAAVIVARHEFAHGRSDEALALYEEAFGHFPDERSRAQAHYDLGNLLVQEGRIEEAQEQYELALAEMEFPSERSRGDAHHEVANRLAQSGHAAEAQAYYERALQFLEFKDVSQLAIAHYDLANLFAQQGYSKEAIAYYERALHTWAALSLAHNNLGVLLAHEGDFAGATHHLKQATELDPRHFLAALSLANVYAITGREVQALEILDRVLGAMPKLEAPRKARDAIRDRLDDPSAARLELQPMIHFLPGTLDAYLLLDLSKRDPAP